MIEKSNSDNIKDSEYEMSIPYIYASKEEGSESDLSDPRLKNYKY